jgi:hypothetical protein
MKPENLMFGHLGNGVTVCDRNRMGYITVAHIGYHRKVKYYTADLSDNAKTEIEDFANLGNMAVSASQPDRFALNPINF